MSWIGDGILWDKVSGAVTVEATIGVTHGSLTKVHYLLVVVLHVKSEYIAHGHLEGSQ